MLAAVAVMVVAVTAGAPRDDAGELDGASTVKPSATRAATTAATQGTTDGEDA
jgi:hypothetical protein